MWVQRSHIFGQGPKFNKELCLKGPPWKPSNDSEQPSCLRECWAEEYHVPRQFGKKKPKVPSPALVEGLGAPLKDPLNKDPLNNDPLSKDPLNKELSLTTLLIRTLLMRS